MIAPVGISQINHLLKVIKEDEHETQKVHEEKANDFFNNKISALEGQVEELKTKASKIGGMAIFNFVMGLVTTAVDTASSFFGMKAGDKGLATKFGKLALGTQLGGGFLKATEKAVDKKHEQDKVEIDANIKNLGIESETMGKLSQEAKRDADDAKKRAAETLQTMREVRNNTIEGQSAMVRI